MLTTFIITAFVILALIQILHPLTRAWQLVVTGAIILLVIFASWTIAFYHKHHVSLLDYLDYKRQALRYAEQFDPAHTYTFIGLEDLGCKWMQGCSLEVYLQSKTSTDPLTVSFHNGRLVPFAPAAPAE